MTEWNPQANALLLQALEIADLTERQRFLDRACGADAVLRAQVDSLLAGHEQAGDFLDAPHQDIPAPPVVPRRSEYTGPFVEQHGDSSDAQLGTVVAGRYKLLQQIGEGGMGTVWMAQQTEPVKRRVAVKLIRADRGSSKALLARFEAERQAIALMDHPNIGRLLEAGTTEVGSPFFVMELVKGIPLTDFCDEHKLGIPQRLDLFMQICSAVQHAHQKGIIHRDLKPTNILVDHARRRRAHKRGGDRQKVKLSDLSAREPDDDLVALDEVLCELERHDPIAAELVKLRYFSGVTHSDAAKVLGLIRRQADGLWVIAKAWLYRRLKPD